ncbi:MAG TPA: hypothetical protein VLW85_13355 [Myxococcales bacterium]|nr:hypothetical protein [Myxococcales bacterium]
MVFALCCCACARSGEDACAFVACPVGLSCDPADGSCKSPLCASVQCPAPQNRCQLGSFCDPFTGKCSAQVIAQCPQGEACDLADGACRAAVACVDGACAASDLCHLAGTCDAATNRCSPEALKECPPGQMCDPADGACQDAELCAGVVCPAASDACHFRGSCDPMSGLCLAQTAKICAAGLTCDPADGRCKAVDLCAGVTCPAPADLCHLPGACNPATGFCSTQPLKACPDGQQCDPADGTCKTPSLCVGVVCPVSDACHLAGSCDPASGACSPQTAKPCSSGEACDPADGQCKPAAVLVPRPQLAKALALASLNALAFDAAGALYAAGSLAGTQTLDGIPVSSAGDTDLLLARYDPATRSAAWAVSFGDASTQLAQGAAVTSNGVLAAVGTFSGTMAFGNSTLSSASAIDFLAAVDTARGRGLWARQFNDGSNGKIQAVASNPGSPTNRIAVCGKASAAATDLVGPGAAFAGASDIVIAVFDSAGTRMWAAQLGSTGNQECDALALDGSGDVYAAGKFDSASLTFPGSAPFTLTGPGSSTKKYVWVAKFAGAGSGGAAATVAAAAFADTGNGTPLSLAADASGSVVVGGTFTGTLTVGSTAMPSAGGTDAWMAKLDPSAGFAPSWAVRLGGAGGDAANALAVDSAGNAIVTGGFQRTTTGAAALTASGTTASDVFVLEIGPGGDTRFAAAYGDANPQTGTALAVFQTSVAYGGTFSGTLDFGSPAGALAVPTSDTQAFLVFAELSP